jgi:hypothetical protein
MLNKNVCDILIVRRRPERAPNRPLLRQMLCTNNTEILRSENGLRVLNYRGSFVPKKVNERKHNLIVTWDIMMQDYRNVNMDECYLMQKIPADDRFWEYFNESILTLSPKEKMRYMDLDNVLDPWTE